MQLSTKYIARIKALAEKQYNDFINGEPIDNMVGFVFCDTLIINPFISENGMEDVDPIEYYGESFLKSEFCTMEVE